MSAETPISRSVLSDTVKDRLLEAILDGRYPPGSRIIETRAAREFGTSQAPVREALRDLEALGVVEIAPFRGARVRHPSRDELLEAYVVRAELEALGVRLAVPRLTGDDLDQLGTYLADMRRAAAAGDTVGGHPRTPPSTATSSSGPATAPSGGSGACSSHTRARTSRSQFPARTGT